MDGAGAAGVAGAVFRDTAHETPAYPLLKTIVAEFAVQKWNYISDIILCQLFLALSAFPAVYLRSVISHGTGSVLTTIGICSTRKPS